VRATAELLRQSLGLIGRSLLCSLALLAPAGCALVLDFDEFESCAQCTEKERCEPGACVDQGCFPPPEEDPQCKPKGESRPRCSGASTGELVKFLAAEPLKAYAVLQTEVLTTKDTIYQTSFIRDAKGHYDVVVHAYDTTGEVIETEPRRPTASLQLSKLLTRENEELVAPGVLVAPRAEGEAELVLFTAVREVGYSSAFVVRLDLSKMLEPKGSFTDLTEFPNLLVDSVQGPGRRGPAAQLLADGRPFAVWQGCKPDPHIEFAQQKDVCKSNGDTPNNAIYASSAQKLSGRQMVNQGIEEPHVAASIQALGGGPAPAAVWATAPWEGSFQIKSGLPTAGTSSELLQCGRREDGDEVQWLHATRVFGATSDVGWTTSGLSEVTGVTCTDEHCRDTMKSQVTDPLSCPDNISVNRVYTDVSSFAHGYWAAGTRDVNAQAVVAYVLTEAASRQLLLTSSRGTPDPNRHRLLDSSDHAELSTTSPAKVTLDLEPYVTPARRAVVGVGWIERETTARLSAFDLCLEP
jgi:hypothetical protein